LLPDALLAAWRGRAHPPCSGRRTQSFGRAGGPIVLRVRSHKPIDAKPTVRDEEHHRLSADDTAFNGVAVQPRSERATKGRRSSPSASSSSPTAARNAQTDEESEEEAEGCGTAGGHSYGCCFGCSCCAVQPENKAVDDDAEWGADDGQQPPYGRRTLTSATSADEAVSEPEDPQSYIYHTGEPSFGYYFDDYAMSPRWKASQNVTPSGAVIHLFPPNVRAGPPVFQSYC
jgi:hypothetical protein